MDPLTARDDLAPVDPGLVVAGAATDPVPSAVGGDPVGAAERVDVVAPRRPDQPLAVGRSSDLVRAGRRSLRRDANASRRTPVTGIVAVDHRDVPGVADRAVREGPRPL